VGNGHTAEAHHPLLEAAVVGIDVLDMPRFAPAFAARAVHGVVLDPQGLAGGRRGAGVGAEQRALALSRYESVEIGRARAYQLMRVWSATSEAGRARGFQSVSGWSASFHRRGPRAASIGDNALQGKINGRDSNRSFRPSLGMLVNSERLARYS